MVVGDEQTIRRHETAGPAIVEAHGREPSMFEPGVGEVEAVLLLEPIARRIVEQPHALIGIRWHCKGPQKQNGEAGVHGGSPRGNGAMIEAVKQHWLASMTIPGRAASNRV